MQPEQDDTEIRQVDVESQPDGNLSQRQARRLLAPMQRDQRDYSRIQSIASREAGILQTTPLQPDQQRQEERDRGDQGQPMRMGGAAVAGSMKAR